MLRAKKIDKWKRFDTDTVAIMPFQKPVNLNVKDSSKEKTSDSSC